MSAPETAYLTTRAFSSASRLEREIWLPRPGVIHVARGARVEPGSVVATVEEPASSTAASREILAPYLGVVTHVRDGEMLVIEGHGAWIQGVWGHGPPGAGLLRLMLQEPRDALPLALLTAGLRGSLLVAGTLHAPSTLQTLQEIGIAGLVLGSMEAALLPLLSNITFPVLLTEGFGNLPISDPHFALLQSLDGRPSSLSGQHPFLASHHWPEIFIPRSGEPESLPATAPLQPGDPVRIVSDPYLSQQGTIRTLTPRRTRFPNGITALTCEVQLENGERVHLPFTNLERLAQ